MVRIGIFGSTGFIGRHSCNAALDAGYEVHAFCRFREQMHSFDRRIICHLYDNIISSRNSHKRLPKLDCALHLADNADRRSATEGLSLKITQQIAKALISAGVTKLVYLSSVYARSRESDTANTYGSGKLASENCLREQQALKTIIIRVPPVYGPGSKGGVQFLSSLISKRIPIPFKSALEPRDYLHISNLTDLFLDLTQLNEDGWDQLKSRSFEVSDGVPVSTAKLIKEIAAQVGKPPILFSAPKLMLDTIGKLTGKSAQISAAFGGLRVENDEELMSVCGWNPTNTMPATLAYLREASVYSKN